MPSENNSIDWTNEMFKTGESQDPFLSQKDHPEASKKSDFAKEHSITNDTENQSTNHGRRPSYAEVLRASNSGAQAKIDQLPSNNCVIGQATVNQVASIAHPREITKKTSASPDPDDSGSSLSSRRSSRKSSRRSSRISIYSVKNCISPVGPNQESNQLRIFLPRSMSEISQNTEDSLEDLGEALNECRFMDPEHNQSYSKILATPRTSRVLVTNRASWDETLSNRLSPVNLRLSTEGVRAEAKVMSTSKQLNGGYVGHSTIPVLPKPRQIHNSRRSSSRSMRLERQGYRSSASSDLSAVKSIRRGSLEWDNVMRLFVSDLVFRSLVCHRVFQKEVCFRAYTCHAAVLFVDLSNYSKIASIISHQGAHALSNVVNAYLDRLLEIVQQNGGDVVKFAGDAVLIVWEGANKDLEINVLAAAKCVMEMQRMAGEHPIEGTDLSFRIHCGLCCGHLISEVFHAPKHKNMQPTFHSVGGETIKQIGELVDKSMAGEVAISNDCIELLQNYGHYRDVNGFEDGKILTKLELDPSALDKIELHINRTLRERFLRRNQRIEEGFIHPRVIQLLSHGGLSPTHISQMRNLCVLFIAKTSHGSSVNWLMEVASILDKNRCPIVQIIDDDKGVHVIAAINLYDSVPETSLAGLHVCQELVEQQVGCAVGMAMGSTFCGVTGSSSVACRWDITGPPPVRAARLMQYALQENLEVAIDGSVYDDPLASTKMKVYKNCVELKGSSEPIVVCVLSSSTSYAAFRVLETVHARVHQDFVRRIKQIILESGNCCAVVVTGIPLSGKKIICQRAAGEANLVPYLHLSSVCSGFLQLARTIATWFQYVDDPDIQRMASEVSGHLDKNRWSRAHDQCIFLVDAALSRGLRACFLIDRVQFLDEFSLSLIRECLQYPRSKHSNFSTATLNGFDSSKECHSVTSATGIKQGKVCFLCVHGSLYNWITAPQLVEDLARSHVKINIPIIEVGEAQVEELRTMFRDLSDMSVEKRWLDAYSEASGLCAGYFIERAAAIRVLSGKLWSEGKRAYAETTEELVLSIPPGLVRKNKNLPVRYVSAEVSMRFSQIFDELPPLFQFSLKILTLATRTYFYELPRSVLWEVLNDLIDEGVEMDLLDSVIREMQEMCLIKAEIMNGEDVISYRIPALADIAADVSTPVQINSICEALIDRLEPLQDDFRVSIVLACLNHDLNRGKDTVEKLWQQAYDGLIKASQVWDDRKVNKWKELIQDEIRHQGGDEKSLLGDKFTLKIEVKPVVGKRLPLLKIYSAPVSLGPMGHTLSVITRNTFHEHGIFHGYSEQLAHELRRSTKSAYQRYLEEMTVLEGFLTTHGFSTVGNELRLETEMMEEIATPAKSSEEVQRKAIKILDEFVPRFVETRIGRLRNLVEKIRKESIPDCVTKAEPAIRRAFQALRVAKDPTDAAQDALMILATMNWKPKRVPEYLPLIHYQTVARLRTKVLKRLSKAEFFIFKHQQTVSDLEAFLIVTPLLQQAKTK